MHHYLTAMSKYFDFSGRATRSEYWIFVLFTVLFGLVATFADMLMGFSADLGPIYTLFALVHLIPSLSVFVRRLHDIDRTGWWFLILFIPLIGLIVALVFLLTATTPGPNRYGPDPFASARPRAPKGYAEGGNVPLQELEKIAALRASGAITEPEFEEMKRRLMGTA